jgi:hypothetical protein
MNVAIAPELRGGRHIRRRPLPVPTTERITSGRREIVIRHSQCTIHDGVRHRLLIGEPKRYDLEWTNIPRQTPGHAPPAYGPVPQSLLMTPKGRFDFASADLSGLCPRKRRQWQEMK